MSKGTSFKARLCRVRALGYLLVASSSFAFAIDFDEAVQQFDSRPSPAPAISAQPVVELFVTLSDNIVVGPADDGDRTIVPITGGHFRGEGMRGVVNAGGADWQTLRPDGTKEIVAIYSIVTDDGQTIVVDNRGISRSGSDGRYVSTTPTFHAPRGKYDWLNHHRFVGTITSVKEEGLRAVIIRAYKVL
ncbi:DUF3237 family protein [Parahaliea maris]|nr:DUF3237 family protein [Parahaliea maris]